MWDIVAVYTIPGEISWVPVTKIVYVLESAVDSDCGEIVKYSDWSDGTWWIETNGGGWESDITEKFEISSAEILTSNSNPVTLIPAPWAWKGILITWVPYVRYTFWWVAYATNISAHIRYNSDSNAPILPNIFLWSWSSFSMGFIQQLWMNINIDNMPVTFITASWNPTAWNWTIAAYITYRIIDL